MAAGPAERGLQAGAGRDLDRAAAGAAEIGFDQSLDEHVPLDTTFRDETGDGRAARRLLRQAAGGAGVRLLRLPDALHAGAQRPGERARRAVARRRARISRSSRSASIRATRRRRPRRRRPTTSSATSAPAPSDGWHFLTGEQPQIERLTKAAGFRYVWDDRDEAVRAPDRHDRADARTAGWRDISSASSTARAICASPSSRRRPARSARRSIRCCSTAITTTR